MAKGRIPGFLNREAWWTSIHFLKVIGKHIDSSGLLHEWVVLEE